MKIAFTGDLVLQEVDKSPKEVFKNFKHTLKKIEAELCVNLESPFVYENMKPIKDKITLYAHKDKVDYLKYLSPAFVNLSNNHINDFGNLSSQLTMSVLREADIDFLGIGFEDNRENVLINNDNKIIHIAFSTRSTDFTGSKLFAKADFIGPYPPDLQQVADLKKQYPAFKIIINIHWGIEDIRYPEPEKRTLAYQLIDKGADMIIGHHPHIIQPYEKYKGKYIMYSIGNFYFPDLYSPDKKEVLKKALPHQKKGIVPVFDIKNNIELISILQVNLDKNDCLNVKETSLKELGFQNKAYKTIHPIYQFVLFNIRRVFRVLKNPGLVIKKLT